MFIAPILCDSDKIILEDNLHPSIDKISHSTTSFGLYYTFRYFGHKKVKAIIILQSWFRSKSIKYMTLSKQEHFRGVSLHDIFIISIGISSAFIVDAFITKKTEKSKKKLGRC